MNGARFAAIVVAAGRGTRFGRPKQLVELAGRPMLAWSIETFAQMPEVHAVIVATEGAWIDEVRSVVSEACGGKHCAVVPGGATRAESARAALAAVPPECTAAFVHDGARPLVRAEDVRRAMALVAPGTGAILAEPVVDTIKVVDAQTHVIERTLDRAQLWAAQTPQFAMLDDLRRAHALTSDDREITDDAMLLEWAGVRVHVVPSSGENFKVTRPQDLERAERVLRERLGERV